MGRLKISFNSPFFFWEEGGRSMFYGQKYLNCSRRARSKLNIGRLQHRLEAVAICLNSERDSPVSDSALPSPRYRS